MNNLKTLLISGLILLAVNGIAQDVEKETVATKKGSTKTSVLQASFSGYNGTKSDEARAYFNEGVKQGRLKNFDEAKKAYQKAIKADKNYVEAYDNLGLLYRRNGDLKNAIKYYKKSIEIYPGGVLAHQNLAAVYNMQKQPELAIEEYKQIIEIDPDNAEGYYGIANTYLGIQKFDEALEYARTALGIYIKDNSPHLADGYQMIGIIYYYKGDKEKAKKNLSMAKTHGAKIHPALEKELF